MEKIMLDFTGCRSREELFAVLRAKLDWEEWMGDNLDALHDVLSGFAFRGDAYELRFASHYGDERAERTAQGIEDVFMDTAREYGEFSVRAYRGGRVHSLENA